MTGKVIWLSKGKVNAKDNITFSDLKMKVAVNKYSDQKNAKKTVCSKCTGPRGDGVYVKLFCSINQWLIRSGTVFLSVLKV